MTSEVVGIIEQISREKGIEKNTLVDALKSAMEAAARKLLGAEGELHTEFNEESGEVEVYAEKTVVNEVNSEDMEISLQTALEIDSGVVLGEKVLVHQPLESYGRIAAQLAKQVIVQKVREAEVDLIYEDFQHKKGALINGIVQRSEHGDIIVDLGKTEGVVPRREQVFRESFNRGDRIRAYVLDIRRSARNVMVILSRTHTGLIKNLFELEVPEISEGMVEIMGIVREANGRTKIAVKTNDRDVDAVGACVGMRGMRVQSIVQELRGEKIDIVEHSEDPEVFVRNALSPAKISRIIRDNEEHQMTIIVTDDQMSLAIGKKGQNVRLAAKLVGWRINIQGSSEVTDLFKQPSLLTSQEERTAKIDFLVAIKSAKGFGEKIIGILFANDVVTVEKVIELGIPGLSELSGIGPKKAEAILSFTQSLIEEVADEKLEENIEDAEEEVGEEEEPEIPVGELSSIDPEIIKRLTENGFETMAELSITPPGELAQIEEIDTETAETIINQAKKRMESMGSV